MPGNNPADFEDRAIPDMLRSLFASLPQPVGLDKKIDLGEERREITRDELSFLFQRKLETLGEFAAENLAGDNNRCFTFKIDIKGYVDGQPFTGFGTSGSVTIAEGMDLGADGARLTAPFEQTFNIFSAQAAELSGETFEIEMQAEVSAYRDVVRGEGANGGLPIEQFLKEMGFDVSGGLPGLPEPDKQ
jgi:hypothetical protein